MTNLLEETIRNIEFAGQSEDTVLWVGSHDGIYSMEWKAFAYIADVRYDSSYGAAEVAQDLVVVFADGSWLERGEYDGSEWWDYKKPPVIQGAKQFTKVNGGMWRTLAEMNTEED